MPDEPKRPNKETRGPRSLFAVASLSVVVGAFTGGVGALFRVFLHSADGWRTDVIVRAHSWGLPGLLSVVLGIALISSLAAWMVSRFAPGASGSGIPDVERQLRAGRFENPLPIVIVKFIGGLLAIGGGLVLGREGPTVQMGSGIGDLVGRAFQRNENECRLLLAAGAGAGLATAFNAPIAGAIFVLEELTGSFEIAVTATTLGASASAICVSRVFLGQSPDFQVPALGFLNFGVFSVSLVIGMLMGLLGVAYNRCILAGLDLASGRLPSVFIRRPASHHWQRNYGTAPVPSLPGSYPVHRYCKPFRHLLAFLPFPVSAGYRSDLLQSISLWDEEGFSSC
jgi:CIC family chloride channel protein